MLDLFKDIVPSILINKTNVFQDDDYTAYDAYIINKALSHYIDCIFPANQMNVYSFLDKEMQYSYYLNTIRSMKRFEPWQKKSVDEDVKAIKEYFGYSTEKAKQAMLILNTNQIAEIKDKIIKGGVKK